ncbi:MAG: hypothetical protein DU429_02145 [Candidatus Tokpelaia sp.]|nr:MAG: hypothetical protein DU430_03865 [Candidatus Tokpelaia sp.]KAA6207299.1 MAG: hypothetical protein DU429_02145 [Candidatus Tokpelaia sp.]
MLWIIGVLLIIILCLIIWQINPEFVKGVGWAVLAVILIGGSFLWQENKKSEKAYAAQKIEEAAYEDYVAKVIFSDSNWLIIQNKYKISKAVFTMNGQFYYNNEYWEKRDLCVVLPNDTVAEITFKDLVNNRIGIDFLDKKANYNYCSAYDVFVDLR